jgi:glutamate/aspartate transport system permease protein
MSIDWNWGIFLQQAPFGNTTYLGWLWSGFQVTIALSISAWIIAFFVGSLFGILRTAPTAGYPASAPATLNCSVMSR